MASILVIDDDAAISHLYARWLGDKHTVAVLGDSPSAVARVQQGERFDAIVCDVHMPKLSGFEVHAEIARIDPEQARRMVFVTAGPVRVERARGPNVSNPLLFKPFRLEELLEHIAAFAPIGPAQAER